MYWHTLKKFKNQFHLVRRAVEDTSLHNIGIKIAGDKAKGLTSSLEFPPEKEIARFAAVLKPLADPSNPLYYKNIILILTENKLLHLSDSDRKHLEADIRNAEAGGMQLKFNDEPLSAIDLYNIYLNGEFISEREPEAKKIEEFKKIPFLYKMMLFQFYSYCCDIYKFCGYLYSAIKEIEKSQNTIHTPTNNPPELTKCIYCLKDRGSFTSEEHVYPESLGNTEIILPPGNVCDECNNGVLSRLDQHLVEHDAISFLKLLYVPYNPKTGKFSKVCYQNMTIEKTSPRKIFFNQTTGKRKNLAFKEVDGELRGNISLTGRKKFNPKRLGQSLYKIALGIICWKHGTEIALEERYDLSREFILGKRSFPNNLFISKNCTPCPEIEGTHFFLNPGTLFIMNIFGITFAFNLEVEPILQKTPLSETMEMQCFSLSE
jgi:hypothetical protein